MFIIQSALAAHQPYIKVMFSPASVISLDLDELVSRWKETKSFTKITLKSAVLRLPELLNTERYIKRT